MKQLIPTSFILIIIFFSCKNEIKRSEKIEPSKTERSSPEKPMNAVKSKDDYIAEFKKKYVGTGKLLAIDLTDSLYTDVNFYYIDTITKDGWKIEYLVKDDKTKYDDLYIRWSKGVKSEIYCAESTLLMRSYFIPAIKGENESHLFLEHGCSTSGQGVLVLPKNTKESAKDFCFIRDYSVKFNKIAYIPERSFSLEELEIAISDLTSGKEKSVVFENDCTLSPEEGCIDQIIFNKSNVKIIATLIDRKNGDKKIVEQHSVNF